MKGDIYPDKPDLIVKTETGTCYIYHPIISDEERARRMKLIHDAAARLIIATARCEAEQAAKAEAKAARTGT